MCHSEQTFDYTHVDTFNIDHTHLSDVVDLVGLSLSVSYHVTVHSTLDHGQGCGPARWRRREEERERKEREEKREEGGRWQVTHKN